MQTKNDDSPAITLENHGHLMSFVTLVLLVLSRTLHSDFAAACFMQSQARTLLEVLGHYVNAVLAAPLNARTILFYTRLADCMRILCGSDFPASYLQQLITRLLAARLKEGVSSALLGLDQCLVTLCQATRMPLQVTVMEALRQETWAMEQTPEASSLRVRLHFVTQCLTQALIPGRRVRLST